MNTIMNQQSDTPGSRIRKYCTLLAVLILCLALLLTGCAQNSGEADDTTPGVETTGYLDVNYDTEDTDATWDDSSAVHITLADRGSTVSGSGVTIDANSDIITIEKAGTYVLTGSLSDGQIMVSAPDSAIVRIILNGVFVESSDGPALMVETCEKAIVTLADGSENTLSSLAYATDASEDLPNAVLYSSQDLTLNGSGSLTVDGMLDDGIKTTDSLVITGGEYDITAVNDALRGKDSIAILDGTFTLTTSQGDGIQASNSEDAEKGWISIDGGTFDINAAGDGVKAETLLQVMAGTLDVTSGDDGLHSNSTLLIKDGDISLSAGDDGAHSNTLLQVDGGTLTVTASYEGLESTEIRVQGGDISLVAKDDGLNAAGGNDASSMDPGGHPQDQFAAEEGTLILISGGSLTIDSGGDGIDSNGDLSITGGDICVSGPTSNGDSPMDYNGSGEVTGGTFVIAGSAGMAETPSSGSTQNTIAVYFTETISAGTSIVLKNSAGETVLSFTPEKAYAFALLGSAALEKGQTYTLYLDGKASGGLTVTGTVTNVDEAGSTDIQAPTRAPGPTGSLDNRTGATSDNA